MTLDTLLDELNEKFKHHDLEILRTVVPDDANQKTVDGFYVSAKIANFDVHERWVIRSGRKTFMASTLRDALEKALA